MTQVASRPLGAIALVAATFCTGLAGCTAEQAYSSGQSWQRNECQKMPDAGSRSRCLEAAGLSADAYRRESEAAKAAR